MLVSLAWQLHEHAGGGLGRKRVFEMTDDGMGRSGWPGKDDNIKPGLDILHTKTLHEGGCKAGQPGLLFVIDGLLG